MVTVMEKTEAGIERDRVEQEIAAMREQLGAAGRLSYTTSKAGYDVAETADRTKELAQKAINDSLGLAAVAGEYVRDGVDNAVVGTRATASRVAGAIKNDIEVSKQDFVTARDNTGQFIADRRDDVQESIAKAHQQKILGEKLAYIDHLRQHEGLSDIDALAAANQEFARREVEAAQNRIIEEHRETLERIGTLQAIGEHTGHAKEQAERYLGANDPNLRNAAEIVHGGAQNFSMDVMEKASSAEKAANLRAAVEQDPALANRLNDVVANARGNAKRDIEAGHVVSDSLDGVHNFSSRAPERTTVRTEARSVETSPEAIASEATARETTTQSRQPALRTQDPHRINPQEEQTLIAGANNSKVMKKILADPELKARIEDAAVLQIQAENDPEFAGKLQQQQAKAAEKEAKEANRIGWLGRAGAVAKNMLVADAAATAVHIGAGNMIKDNKIAQKGLSFAWAGGASFGAAVNHDGDSIAAVNEIMEYSKAKAINALKNGAEITVNIDGNPITVTEYTQTPTRKRAQKQSDVSELQPATSDLENGKPVKEYANGHPVSTNDVKAVGDARNNSEYREALLEDPRALEKFIDDTIKLQGQARADEVRKLAANPTKTVDLDATSLGELQGRPCAVIPKAGMSEAEMQRQVKIIQAHLPDAKVELIPVKYQDGTEAWAIAGITGKNANAATEFHTQAVNLGRIKDIPLEQPAVSAEAFVPAASSVATPERVVTPTPALAETEAPAVSKPILLSEQNHASIQQINETLVDFGRILAAQTEALQAITASLSANKVQSADPPAPTYKVIRTLEDAKDVAATIETNGAKSVTSEEQQFKLVTSTSPGDFAKLKEQSGFRAQ